MITILVISGLLSTILYVILLIAGKQSIPNILRQRKSSTSTNVKNLKFTGLRVAVHLSGQVRCPLDNIKNNIIKPLIESGCKVDIYTFLSDVKNSISILDPYVVSKVTDIEYPHIHTLKLNSLKMYYRMKILQQLCDKSGKEYDIIIRSRPDLVFREPLALKGIDVVTFIPRLSLSTNTQPKTMTDIFFYGPVSDMRLLNNIFDSFSETSCINPELYLFNYVIGSKIKFIYDTTVGVIPVFNSVEKFRIKLDRNLTTVWNLLSTKDCHYRTVNDGIK